MRAVMEKTHYLSFTAYFETGVWLSVRCKDWAAVRVCVLHGDKFSHCRYFRFLIICEACRNA